MKIGSLRRIDELGRIVIPKTVREALRIKSGDRLEIYTENENIILKKHSTLNELEEISIVIKEVLKNITKAEIIITDKNKIITATENSYQNKKISNELLKILEERNIIIKENISITDETEDESIYLVNPIIINGDIIGSIILKSKENIIEKNITATKTMTHFLEKYIE